MDDQETEKIYERLKALSLDLPRDPSSLGPDFLREQISICRNYLNEVAHYLQDVMVAEARLATRLDAEEASFQIRSSELLASDPAVAARPSIADRQALIDTLLQEDKHRIIRLQGEIRSVTHVKAVIRHRQVQLDNTMSAIRLQRSLLKTQLNSGAFYGDESEKSRGGRVPDPVDDLDHVDLEALVAASEADLEVERAARVRSPVERKPRSAASVDPVDSLEATELEALISGVEPVLAPATWKDDSTEVNAEPSDEANAAPSADPRDEASEKALDEALTRFLDEPDDDVESLVSRL